MIKTIAVDAPSELIRIFLEREKIQIPNTPKLPRPVELVRTISSLKVNPIENRPKVTIADSAAPLSIEPISIILVEIAFFE